MWMQEAPAITRIIYPLQLIIWLILFSFSVACENHGKGKPYSFSSSLSHNQNTITHDISLSLPTTNFSVNRLYPFKRQVVVGTEKWFEKIGISYQNNFQNSIQKKKICYCLKMEVPTNSAMECHTIFQLAHPWKCWNILHCRHQ